MKYELFEAALFGDSLSIASWDDDNLIKVTILDNDGYNQCAYLSKDVIKSIRDHLTSILEEENTNEIPYR